MEKTEDIFLNVIFHYDSNRWFGVVPLKIKYHGIQIDTEEEYLKIIIQTYQSMAPKKEIVWIREQELFWEIQAKRETYNVFQALLKSSQWICRACGLTGNATAHLAPRIRDLKKMGYTIATQRRDCPNCGNKHHDILIKLPRRIDNGVMGKDFRASLSPSLIKKIKKVLNYQEAVFNVIRHERELLIDHKFPSQRWRDKEIPYNSTISAEEIKKRFQLLTNQTNMWKSRMCDKCVANNQRGNFFGIIFYYKGNGTWRGRDRYDEEGCEGCPWYDTIRWREELNLRITTK